MRKRTVQLFFLGGVSALATAIAIRFLMPGLLENQTVIGDHASNGTARGANSPASKPSAVQASSLSGFVGIAECASCHSNQHQSWLLTAHSRAISLVDPESEPPDGQFFHDKSGRSFRVDRRQGQLWHTESMAPATKVGVTTSEQHSLPEFCVPVKYLVGSGRHSRTYLTELDGFLMESPHHMVQLDRQMEHVTGL